jgi:hypothetical protein
MKITEISCNILVATHFQNGYKAMLLKDLKHFNQSKINNNKLLHGLPVAYYSAADIASKFTFLKANTIQKYLKELTLDGILFSTVCNKYGYDKTKSYLVNFAYYDAISNGNKYPQSEIDRFILVCRNAVKNTNLNCKTLEIDIMILSQWNMIKSQSNMIKSQPIPTNISTNISTNNQKVIITEKNNNQKVKSLDAKKLEVDTDKVKAIYKNQFPNFAINDSKYNKSLLNESITILEANLKTYNAANNICEAITLESNYDNLNRCLKAISSRIDANNLSIMNLRYFNTIIENEPIQNFQDDSKRLLDLVSAEQKANYYKIAARDGANIATEKLRNLLTKQGKI